MGASGVNWNNVPHESILSQINGGAGVGPVSDAAVSYQRIANMLRDADHDLRDALGTTGAAWEGQAAADMQTASTPLATWADEADQMAVKTSSSTEMFGDQFSSTRSGMPAAVDVPSGSWVDGSGLSNLPGVTTDRERAEAAADAAQQEAARRMEAYDNASHDTVRTQYFSQPPAVVLEIPPPSSTGGQQVGGTSTTSGGATDARAYAPTGSSSSPTAVSQTLPPTGGGTQNVIPSATTPPASVGPNPVLPPNAGPVLPGGGYPPGTGPGGTLPPPITGVPGVPGGTGSDGRPGTGARPGLPGRGFGPGGFGPGGPGGFGAGAGPGSGGLGADAHGQRGMGPGALVDPDGRPGLAGRPGGPGAGAGYGPMGAGRRGEDDTEHKRADYLVETEDVWGDGTRVAPPVIGDRPAQ